MKYKTQICQNEYNTCMKKCLRELELLEEKIPSYLRTDEDKALLKKLKKELKGKRRGHVQTRNQYSR